LSVNSEISYGIAHSELLEGKDYDKHIERIRPESGGRVYESLQRARDKSRSIIAKELAKLRDIQRGERGPGNRRRPSDASTVRQAIHYGNQAGLSSLSGIHNGTGIKGAEDQRLKGATDPRIKRRVYFYSPVAGGIPQPEVGLGGSVYQADLSGIYDPSTANQAPQGSGNAFESDVLDAGYDGHLDRWSFLRHRHKVDLASPCCRT